MSCKHVVPLLCPPNIFPVHSCQLVSYNTFICNFLCSSQISLSTAFIHLTIFNSSPVISTLLLSSPVCVCVSVSHSLSITHCQTVFPSPLSLSLSLSVS